MGHKILIVEDDESIANLVKINLELEGYQTLMAADGEEAIQALDTETPDLVVLDLMIPKFDGWEVLKHMNETRRDNHLPVIITSAKTQKEDLDKGAAFGVVDYLVKPFDPQDLINKIQEVLQ
ncbi:MAG: response regulator [Armatimonadetes bacterium]|nr:response regulator [Armatimonadota bacterium]